MGQTSSKIMEKTERLKNVIPTVDNPYQTEIDGQKVSIYTATVTSKMAKEIVEVTNVKNRVLSQKNIRLYQREMEEGMWFFSGDPLRFDVNGKMLDGQHRLIALSQTKNLQFDMLFITGLKNDAFKVMDTGKKRSAGDVFSVEGVAHPKITATAVKYIHALERGSFVLGETATNKGLTNTEAYEKYKTLKNIDDYVAKGKALNSEKPKLLSDPTVIGFWYVLSCIDKEDADIFMEKLIQGTNLSKNSPIKVVHDTLVRVALNDTYSMKRIDKNKLVALAWKKYRNGEEITKLTIPKTSESVRLLVKDKTINKK